MKTNQPPEITSSTEYSATTNIQTRSSASYYMLLVYLFFVLVRLHEYVPALKGIPLMPVLLVAALICYLSNRRTFTPPSQHKLIIWLLFMMTFSTLVKIGFSESVGVFSMFYPVVILYYLLADAVDDSKKFRGIFRLMILAASVMALHGIQQSIEGIGWTGMDMIKGRIRYVGIFSDPNDLGLFFLTVIPMVVYMASRGHFIGRLFYLAILGLIIYAVFLTESRGTTLGITAIGGLYAFRRFGIVQSATIGAIALVIIMGLDSRVSQIDPGEKSAFQRWDAWKAGYFMTRDNPLLGVGVGGFFMHHNKVAHNTWVQAMGELGIPGYFVWNGIMITSVLMIIKLTSAKPPGTLPPNKLSNFNEDHEISLVLLYSTTGLCFAIFFLTRTYNTLLYILFAMIVAQYINMHSNWRNMPIVTFSQHWGKILVFSVGSVIGFFFLAIFLIRLG